VVVSRRALINSIHPAVICTPIYSWRHGLATQVSVGPGEGLKHDSAVQCDSLVSIERSKLNDFVGALSPAKLDEPGAALACAPGLDRP
jgi:mRNA interferase MazF